MKKRSLIISLFVVLILSAAFTVSSRAANTAGHVLAVKKDVYILRDNNRDIAKPQMELLTKDAVETASRSRTKLFFTDDSVLNLGELSRLEVAEYLYSPEKQRSKSIYRLIDGSVRVVVGRSDLEVHTTSAVAAARGTKFVVWNLTDRPEEQGKKLKKSRKTCVMTLEGKVEFRLKKEAITENTKKSKVIVKAGEISCLEGDSVQDIRAAGSNLLSKWGDEFPVLAGDIPENQELPAFAPEPPVTPDVNPDLPVNQEPVVTTAPGGVSVEVLFPDNSSNNNQPYTPPGN
jgi:hypothetical protein